MDNIDFTDRGLIGHSKKLNKLNRDIISEKYCDEYLKLKKPIVECFSDNNLKD
jgi:hypothetical protein